MDIPERLTTLEKKVDDNVIRVILDNIKSLFHQTNKYSRLAEKNKIDIDHMYENFRVLRKDMKIEMKLIRGNMKWIYLLIVTGILVPILLFIIGKT